MQSYLRSKLTTAEFIRFLVLATLLFTSSSIASPVPVVKKEILSSQFDCGQFVSDKGIVTPSSLRKFLLFNHRSLANEIIEGEGAYLSDLLRQFEKIGANEGIQLESLRSILNDHLATVAFARHIVAEYEQRLVKYCLLDEYEGTPTPPHPSSMNRI